MKRVNQSTPSLFVRGRNMQNTAYLGRSQEVWGIPADGFWQAAELLAGQSQGWIFLQRNTLTYPLVYLYRQYIELKLKETIVEANRHDKRSNNVPPTHKLNGLWAECERIIKERSLPIDKKDLERIKLTSESLTP